MPTISVRQILAAIPNALSLILPENWFAQLPDDLNVFESLYRWIAGNREVNFSALHNRTYVGAALYKRLLAAERRRIAKRTKLRGEKLNAALAFSDLGSGPRSELGGRTLRGNALVVIPEGNDELLHEFARELRHETRESTIRKFRESASGRDFSEWLASNVGRPDPVGDLAADAHADDEFPRDSTIYQTYYLHLCENGASSGATEALSNAWLEYCRQYPDRVILSAWCAGCDGLISDLSEGVLVLNDYDQIEARHSECIEGDEIDSLNLAQLSDENWYDVIASLAERHSLPSESLSEAERFLRLCGFGARDPVGRTRIYFVQAGTSGPIKIGYTAGPVSRRLAALQTSHPDRLRLLAEIEGDRAVEAGLHRRFVAHRRQGEWFAPHPELIEFISVLRPGGHSS